jgi:hypothetical protein
MDRLNTDPQEGYLNALHEHYDSPWYDSMDEESYGQEGPLKAVYDRMYQQQEEQEEEDE